MSFKVLVLLLTVVTIICKTNSEMDIINLTGNRQVHINQISLQDNKTIRKKRSLKGQYYLMHYNHMHGLVSI